MLLFDNDNTLKQHGIEYQKLIALELCLNASPNQQIWIECRGDVANENTSYEIKHHHNEHRLISNSEDAWKTIKNYTENYSATASFDQLVLHTTSSVPVDSIFFEWNKLSAKEKSEKLLSHVPSNTIKLHHDKITAFSKISLNEILKKFSIISEQPKLIQKWVLLKSHSTFTIVPEKYRDIAIQQLHGYITSLSVDNPNEWKIIINDFHRDLRHSLSKFTSERLPFIYTHESELDAESLKINFNFIKKMKDINLKEAELQSAISDYLRAQKTQVKIISATPTSIENLNIYDTDIHKILKSEKSREAYELTAKEIGTVKAEHLSRKIFFTSTSKPHDQIMGFSDTQKYYRDGRIHHIVEEENFEWAFSKDEL